MTTLAFDRAPSAQTASVVLPVVGRVGLAAVFILSGLGKLAAPAATLAYIGAAGLPLPVVGLTLAVLVELGVSTALVLGFHTRLAAAVLALFSVATALIFHNGLSDQNQFIHFFKNIAIAGGLLNIVAFGGGAASLDARRT